MVFPPVLKNKLVTVKSLIRFFFIRLWQIQLHRLPSLWLYKLPVDIYLLDLHSRHKCLETYEGLLSYAGNHPSWKIVLISATVTQLHFEGVFHSKLAVHPIQARPSCPHWTWKVTVMSCISIAWVNINLRKFLPDPGNRRKTFNPTWEYSIINSTTGKCCSEDFFGMVTLEDFIHRLKK